ncbi:hypothetical protein [Rivularia sp. UHCC 0363]|uniref:hypothetical protein n=1 Tax=Rivularia sp. UHCC 0363 TaxID=3110244 RepID=UPI002B210133|nr:hypothetical protein [Rivularia sp. UHCC 0363]MEA5596231.1 hypothetical protein [Rivularia sp. UHCC 0363]
MRYFFSFLLPFCLLANVESAFALKANLQSSPDRNSIQAESFEVVSRRLVTQQVNLISRIEQALIQPDSNKMRAVGGQLFTQTVAVEGFLNQYANPQALCSQNQGASISLNSIPPLSASNLKIYCSLYNSSQVLSKLTPLLDRLLSRRGEITHTRELPLVSGEKQSDLVLPLSPLSRPNLHKPATPYAILEPDANNNDSIFIGKSKKKAIANYNPPVQPAIKPPSEALTTLKNAEKFLAIAISEFPDANNFHNPKKTAAELDSLTYDVYPKEKEIHHKLLSMSNTGIFRVLQYQAYLRPLNTVENRSQKNVLGRYPFPVLAESKGDFTPNLPLQIVKGKFQLLPQGVNYGFIAEVGDIPLEKLDASLQVVAPEKRNIFINYQPPKKLNALQAERQKIVTGKHQISNTVEAKLNHTYLVRNFQFQLPEIIANNQPLTRKQRRYLDQLLEMQSSDVIVAFRPISRRTDGTYTIVWRVLQQLNDPQIDDLESYLTYQ